MESELPIWILNTSLFVAGLLTAALMLRYLSLQLKSLRSSTAIALLALLCMELILIRPAVFFLLGVSIALAIAYMYRDFKAMDSDCERM